jgi:leucine dehydrogenase
MESWDGEQLVLCNDRETGLRAVIAIHDTRLGPALGGVRRAAGTTDAAIDAAQRLAADMTRKNAVVDVPYGGGKAVIYDDGGCTDRAALMHAFGAFVARCGGSYIPGVDMGTTVADLVEVGKAGPEVACSEEDPSPWTARGVAAAIRAALGAPTVAGTTVVVQGAGNVGAPLARLLVADGADVKIADVDTARADALASELGMATVPADDALATPCDVFAPCAVAGVVEAAAVGRLRCKVIAGAANDTLAEPACADALEARGIVYVPDFVANAGGVVHVHATRAGWTPRQLKEAVDGIGGRVSELLADAHVRGCTPLAAADALAQSRLLA